jgi:hypothetical protein
MTVLPGGARSGQFEDRLVPTGVARAAEDAAKAEIEALWEESTQRPSRTRGLR